jgi:catechol 2,3-dioxygenase-like lactoylglutathione lyase family enzyme
MYSHVMVGANDLEKSKAFYDATFAALGVGPHRDDAAHNRFMYLAPTGIFMVSKPIDGDDATFANGGTIGFAASSPEQADAWHAAGVANGGVSIEDPPGVREGAAGKLYLAYLRDPAGNKLCALCRM